MMSHQWNMNFIDSAPVRGGMIGILRVGNNESISLNKIPLAWEAGQSGYFMKPFGMRDAEWFLLTSSGNWLRTFSRNVKRVRFEDAITAPYNQKGWLFTSLCSVFWGKGLQ